MTWGGKREGAGSGGKREGAGRPRKNFDTGGNGQMYAMEVAKQEDGFLPKIQQHWRLIGVEEGTLEFQNEETLEIISITRYDFYV